MHSKIMQNSVIGLNNWLFTEKSELTLLTSELTPLASKFTSESLFFTCADLERGSWGLGPPPPHLEKFTYGSEITKNMPLTLANLNIPRTAPAKKIFWIHACFIKQVWLHSLLTSRRRRTTSIFPHSAASWREVPFRVLRLMLTPACSNSLQCNEGGYRHMLGTNIYFISL